CGPGLHVLPGHPGAGLETRGTPEHVETRVHQGVAFGLRGHGAGPGITGGDAEFSVDAGKCVVHGNPAVQTSAHPSACLPVRLASGPVPDGVGVPWLDRDLGQIINSIDHIALVCACATVYHATHSRHAQATASTM